MKIKLFVVAILLLFSVGSVNAVIYIDTPTVDEYALNIQGETYILLNDTSATGTAFISSVDDVVFDGNGFNVSYANVDVGYGFNSAGSIGDWKFNVTVINTTFLQTNASAPSDSYSIYYDYTVNGLIENNTVTTASGFADGVALHYSSQNTVRYNTLSSSGTGYGAYLHLSQYTNFYENTITSTGGETGLFVFDGNEHTFTDNIITSNHWGIVFDGTFGNILTDNIIVSSGVNKAGYAEFLSSDNTVVGGSITSTDVYDYYLETQSLPISSFTETNWSEARTVFFTDNTDAFKYSNNASSGVFISTNVSTAGKTLTRTINDWSTTSMSFNDTTNANMNVNYVFDGLTDGKTYLLTTIPDVKTQYIVNGDSVIVPYTSGVEVNVLITQNTLPTIPTVITPLDNSGILTQSVPFNLSSTDINGDNITYYIYSDTVDGTTLINISSTGLYSWSRSGYEVYYWKTRSYDEHGFSDYTPLYSFTVLTQPTLTAPTNASTHTYSFPPLLHDLTFAWEETNAPAYKYQVATDADFNLIAEEDTIVTNTTTLSLEADDYYWRVYAYETDTGKYSNASDVWQFTINETNGGAGVTAIDGVVYEITNAGSVAVDGALVNIWNNTWSDSMLVGQNGYYYFDGAKSGTYSVRATKTGYTDSSIELVTVTANETTTRNILLQSTSGAGQQYVDHYVKFIVMSWTGTLYSGVEVNVYLNGAVIPQYTGDTGTDGSISFELDENQEYRFTFIDAAQNINEERTIYPKESEYKIIVFGANIIPDEPTSNDITYSCYGAGINLTYGYINVSFTDASATTTLAELWINDTNMTNLYYFNTTNDSKSWSQVVPGGNTTYSIVFKLTNTELSEPLVISRTVMFSDSIRFSLGLDEGWKYQLIAVVIIVTIGLLFSAVNAEIGAVMIVLVGWFMVLLGWLTAGNTTGENITTGLMLLFATLIAFGSVVRGRDRA